MKNKNVHTQTGILRCKRDLPHYLTSWLPQVKPNWTIIFNATGLYCGTTRRDLLCCSKWKKKTFIDLFRLCLCPLHGLECIQKVSFVNLSNSSLRYHRVGDNWWLQTFFVECKLLVLYMLEKLGSLINVPEQKHKSSWGCSVEQMDEFRQNLIFPLLSWI